MQEVLKHVVSGVDATTRRERSAEERSEALLRFFRNIGGSLGPGELVQAVASELAPLLESDYVSLFLTEELSSGAGCFELTSEGQSVPVLSPESMPEYPVAAWVLQHQQPALIPGCQIHPKQAAEFLSRHGLQSVYAAPLTASPRRLGTIFMGKRRGVYSDSETRFISLVADHLALAINNALKFEALNIQQADSQRISARLKLILDVNNSIASNLELEDLLRSITANLRAVLVCDAAAVSVPDPETGQLRVYALDFPGSKGLAEGFLAPLHGNPMGEAFQSGKPVVNALVRDATDPSWFSVVGRREGMQLGCVFPLFNRDRKLGILSVGRRTEQGFGQDDLDLLAQVATQVAIALGNALAYRQIIDLKDQLAQEKLYLQDEIRSERNFHCLVGHGAELRRVLKQIETVAPTDSTVLIYGETGTGKELIARAIHDLSSRRANTFVKLNCAAIPMGLLESELFGHEKGAFTGAVSQRIGRFEVANRGTMFLDEIGEMPLELQPKLLRVLQDREFERLGSSRTQRTDARLLAATNRDLAAMVEQQSFRSDLYYRLSVFPVHVPPLRERAQDIPLLVRHFVQHFARQMNKAIDTIPAETMKALTHYEWPGNIRELQNLIERAMILSAGPVLRVPLDDLKSRPAGAGATPSKHQTLEDAERAHILVTLQETKWVLSGPRGAATRLGMNRSTLKFRMNKLGIVRPGS